VTNEIIAVCYSTVCPFFHVTAEDVTDLKARVETMAAEYRAAFPTRAANGFDTAIYRTMTREDYDAMIAEGAA
jgi:hypothetical protein